MPGPAGRFGLPKQERVLKSRQFRWVLRRGRRYYTAHFTLVFLGENDVSRLGLTVSRKVGNAVQRNHVKRRLRECYRLHKHLLKSFYWLVIIARPGAAALDYDAICGEVVPFLQGAHALGRENRPKNSGRWRGRSQKRPPQRGARRS